MNLYLKLPQLLRPLTVLALSLSILSVFTFGQFAQGKTVTKTIQFFNSKRQVIGQGEFTYDDTQPYQTINQVEYFALTGFRATLDSQKWSLTHWVPGAQPLLWGPEGESYPTPRIATISSFGILTQGWAFYQSQTSESDTYGVLLIKNPAYRNQGDFALTQGVQKVLEGGLFKIEDLPATAPKGRMNDGISFWQLGLVGVGIF